jgi:glycosyltransferase involved in cell wall biosynthesis
MKIIVLMSTYNGEKYIREQLDSLINQDLRPTKILIRDDGSKDDTLNILEDYASKYNFIEYYYEKNLGPAKSFFDLINKCEDADYYALCDQDDVWFSDKLSSAINMLEKEDHNIPLLYAGRFIITDEKLNPLKSDVSKLYSYTDFAHALLYHTAPGCTFAFNNEARKKIIKYDANKEYIVIHDAIIHKVVTMFGKMILDEEPHMYYRQHKNNAIGLTADKFKELFHRVNNVLSGKLRNYRSNTAKSLLNVYGDECDKDKKELLNIVAFYKENNNYRKQLLNNKCFLTNSVNDIFFKILVELNYI